MSASPPAESKSRTYANERKQRQREQEEIRKVRLREMVRSILPNDPREGKKMRKRKLIDANELMADLVECLKYVKSIPEPKKSPDADLSRYRGGISLSETFGALLLRRDDLHVSESNKGMRLFVPHEVLRGYLGHSLRIATHRDDGDELASVVRRGRVGECVSARLLRACLDESSGCLLLRYVRKELIVSHVSANAVLITCSLSNEDVSPLTSAPKKFEDFFAKTQRAMVPCRSVSYTGVLPSMNWMQKFQSTRPQDSFTCSVFQRMWTASLGLGESMSHLVEDSIRVYPGIVKDRVGRPVFHMASTLRYQGLSTDWNPFLCACLDGRPSKLQISLPGSSAMMMIAGLLLPEQDTDDQHAATCVMFTSEGSLQVVFEYHYLESNQEMHVQFHVGGGKVSRRDAYHVREGGREAELERLLEANTAAECDFWYPPLPVGLQGFDWTSM
mmetsp:Transcript_6596/g.12806  ORF Transcript_6596/g.12806 Transcript_6596/m.12806 type:complete len:446 (+) Transcript_6596:152-1489(+)